jgi:hypothetical protein
VSDPTPPPAANPSEKSTSLRVAVITGLLSLFSTQLPGLSAQIQMTLIIVLGALGLGWIVASAMLKRARLKAGQASAGAGMVALAPHVPALLEAIKLIAPRAGVVGAIHAAPAAPAAAPPTPRVEVTHG